MSETEEFMKSYRKNHMYCPDCGSNEYKTTLIGFPLYLDKKEEYKDMNRCFCLKCGSNHKVHDRISLREFNIIKLLK